MNDPEIGPETDRLPASEQTAELPRAGRPAVMIWGPAAGVFAMVVVTAVLLLWPAADSDQGADERGERGKGGAPAVDRETFIDATNILCRAYRDGLAAVDVAPTRRGILRRAKVYQAAGVVLLKRLRRLDPPAGDDAVVATILNRFERALELQRRAIAAARRRRDTAFRRLNARAAVVQHRYRVAATAYGMQECGRPLS